MASGTSKQVLVFYREDRTKLPAYVEEWIAAKLDEDELLPPTLNPLVPGKLRGPRPVLERRSAHGSQKLYYYDVPSGNDISRDESVWRKFTALSQDQQAGDGANAGGVWEPRLMTSVAGVGADWTLWHAPGSSSGDSSLPLPISPPEPTCRCAFVVQLLSPRPARANVKQAATSQLWLRSFEDDVF